jgi:hypothetical protein
MMLEMMEHYQLQQWEGVSKETYLVGAKALEERFAPDEEVPEDPGKNASAFYRWLEKIGALPPYDRAKEAQRISANPEGWDRMLEILGVPKEMRDLLIKDAIAEAERAKSDQNTKR